MTDSEKREHRRQIARESERRGRAKKKREMEQWACLERELESQNRDLRKIIVGLGVEMRESEERVRVLVEIAERLEGMCGKGR
jgi:hypothetical protein